MNAQQFMKADGSPESIRNSAHMWAYNFLVYALLIDIFYRSIVYRESSWDLFALLGASAVISVAYSARHRALREMVTWRSVIILTFAALFAAVLSALLAIRSF